MEQIQKQYQALCAELGHLTLNQERIQARIQSIRASIAELDKQAADLKAAAQAPKEETKEESNS